MSVCLSGNVCVILYGFSSSLFFIIRASRSNALSRQINASSSHNSKEGIIVCIIIMHELNYSDMILYKVFVLFDNIISNNCLWMCKNPCQCDIGIDHTTVASRQTQLCKFSTQTLTTPKLLLDKRRLCGAEWVV